MKKIVLLCIFLFSTLLGETTQKVSVQLSWLNQFQFAGYYMAKEKGYYNDVGLDVEIKEYSEKSMKTNSDFTIRKSSALIDKMNGSDIVILGTSYQHSPMVLMVLEKSGVNTPKDLFGKKVMVTSDAKDSASVLAMLNSFQLDASNVNFIPHSFNVQDLIDGKTDAMACYISNEPLQLDKLGIKYKILQPKDYGFDFYDDLLTVNTIFLQKNPKLVRDFYEATLKGWQYAYTHIEESARVTYEKYNSQNKTLYDLIEEGEVLKKISYDNDGNFGILDYAKLSEMGSVFKVLGLVKSDFNAKDFIYKYNAPPIISLSLDIHIKIIIAIIIMAILLIIVLVAYYTRTLKREIVQKEIAQKEALLKNDFLQKILDSMGNIVVVTNVKTHVMIMANNELFRFFEIENIEQFKSKYECICDLFVEKEGYLQKNNNGIHWVDYLQENSDQVNKVLMMKDEQEYLYFVYAKFLDETNTNAIAVFTNITDLKAMDDRVANDMKVKALSEMITNIAHHWRQPLSLISTFASTMSLKFEMDTIDKDELYKYSEKIVKITNDISLMLDTFNHKIESNLEIHEEISLKDLVLSLQSYFKSDFEISNIMFHFNDDNSWDNTFISKILFDSIQEIIQNSVEALQHLPDENFKLIVFNINKKRKNIIFTIYDNAGGVSEKNIDKIFEPYFTTYHQSKGKGLGLYFIKNKINISLNGDIYVQNKSFIYENQKYKGLETTIKIGYVS
ncbi:MAG: ABC transporter substrate-binding protein [Arcobacteraceae bacterium]|nr:ABC transporter substrate-binding protein [Arcobacteraceae bacterium]